MAKCCYDYEDGCPHDGTEKEIEQIPEDVLVALEQVRSSGVTNMMGRDTVILHANDYSIDAATWLEDNKSRYMEALTAMGERRS